MRLYAFDIADRLGLRRPCRNTLIKKIVTDSRQVEENTLFAALVGERTDGHDYIPDLDKKFQNVIFLTSRQTGAAHTELVCDDVLAALADIAAMYLDTLPAMRVAVTGSVGKTTTKEMIDCALSGKYRVQKSLANRNNELGMPLTAFSVDDSHEVAIFEMGMRGRGQIDYLARRVRPHVGVITNIGVSHIELLGSRENICKAKMELARYVQSSGVLLLNGDEPLLRTPAREIVAPVKYFAIDSDADYRAENIVIGEKSTKYRLICKKGRFDIAVPGSGKHLVYDSLAAFSVAAELGVEPQVIVQCLQNYEDGGLRQHIYKEADLLIFDDTYNAAPESMQAALSAMAVYPNRKIAVLADILELGDYSVEAHRAVGEACRKNRADILICFGQYASDMADGFADRERCFVCADREEALAKLLSVTKQEDIILFKGSRFMQCDALLRVFLERWKSK
ncbi:MAG: UDP-N-acetylmuramoyl-tripeptide--D-alanyl-D-alanine ligase [Clostridia bacterium]|nr:UDP-N-acetylmuramoyl-tripeptide--D-alanyl-D-alanine ligase [Clostridia bacterium]